MKKQAVVPYFCGVVSGRLVLSSPVDVRKLDNDRADCGKGAIKGSI
jgi:hypothetical protein